jgi:hypothetical protein
MLRSIYLSGQAVIGGGAALPPQPVVTSVDAAGTGVPQLGAGLNPALGAPPNPLVVTVVVDVLEAAALLAAESAFAAACFCAANMAS